jgi:broad specificity phosphatase PhoE
MSEEYDKLSPLGEEQAARLGEFWARHGIGFDQVLHGPAQRHIRTMEIAAAVVKRAGLPWPEPVGISSFDEFDAYQVGKRVLPLVLQRDENVRSVYEEFRARQEEPEAGRLLQRVFEEVARYWCSGDFDVPDLESWAQFRVRIETALRRVRAQAQKSSNIVVFTSAGPIAATVAHVLGLAPAKAIEFVWLSRNCSYSEFLFSGDRFSMSSFNAFPHLNDRSLLTYR